MNLSESIVNTIKFRPDAFNVHLKCIKSVFIKAPTSFSLRAKKGNIIFSGFF